MSGFAVESASTVEVIAAWVAPKTVVTAVSATPGWVVLGEYYLPRTTRARLDVVHIVSAAGLTSRCRLWDVDGEVAVTGSVSSTSTTMTRSLGPAVTLTGDRRYQLQAECTGAAGDDKFAVIAAGTITD